MTVLLSYYQKSSGSLNISAVVFDIEKKHIAVEIPVLVVQLNPQEIVIQLWPHGQLSSSLSKRLCAFLCFLKATINSYPQMNQIHVYIIRSETVHRKN